MNETISIIIPNYNGKKLLGLNLPLIIKLKEEWKEICEIIVVDDKSTDDSIDFLLNNYSQLTVIKKERNSGFIDTANLGIKKAKGSLVFLLNTDVNPDNLNINKLIIHFQNKKLFAVGCLDNSIENGKIVKRGRGIGTFQDGFLLHRLGEINRHSTLWVSGGSGLFRKSIWQQLKGFDPIFSPFYWEDIDICYRALKSGYQLYFEKEAVVIHVHQEGSILKYYTEKQIRKISLRNQILFVWKNISDCQYLLQHIISLFRHLLVSLIRKDFIFIEAFFTALIKLPLIVNYRLFEKKYWVKTDEQILENFTS